MSSMIERFFGRTPQKSAIAELDLTASAKTRAPYATIIRSAGTPFTQTDVKRQAKMLRNFSRSNEFVRIAIERRRDQVSQAGWRIVRVDDPEAPPNPAVVKRFADLARYVNPKRESFATLLDMVVEDVLVLDAGCIEKEKTFGGDLIALYAVDGSTIAPDPNWDGTQQNATRYRQYLNFELHAELRNDQMVYIQNNPTTFSAVGWSPVETLVRIIEAELWGEQYDYQQLRQAAPAGILDIGRGVGADEVEQFREYYRTEIAGGENLAIFGGGDPGQGAGVTFTPFGFSNREQERMAYKTWLAKKIAAVFKLDPMVFGITADTNRSTSVTQKQQTDEGHVTFAMRLQNYITREIVWEIDENHGFVFDDLTNEDEAEQAALDTAYLTTGVWTINEVRARDGLDPVAWGDVPFVPNSSHLDPTGKPVEPPAPPDPNGAPKPPANEQPSDQAGAAKSAVPFVAARKGTGTRRVRPMRSPQTPTASGSYLQI